MALRQDNSLLQAAHDDPPQLLEHTLQHGLFTHSGKQCQPVKHTITYALVYKYQTNKTKHSKALF